MWNGTNDSCTFMVVCMSQTTTPCHNFTIRPSTGEYESRIHSSVYIFYSCNMGTRGLPDMSIQSMRAAGLRVDISGRPQVPVAHDTTIM